MGAKRQARKVIQFTAWLSLLVWVFAIAHCSSLCLLGCGPANTDQVVEYTHEGCEGHPQDSDTGCKDPFCDSVGNAYFSFDQFTFLKAYSPVAFDYILANLQEAPAASLIQRQPSSDFPASPPEVSLRTWNQPHAPPFVS